MVSRPSKGKSFLSSVAIWDELIASSCVLLKAANWALLRPFNAATEHSNPVHSAVQDLPARALVLIMSFSHVQDLDIVAACLLRQRERGDLPFIGLIGSKTKWATFTHRLAARGFTPAELSHVTCPIGVAGITRKEPEVIAVAVAAQLLQVLQVSDRL